MKEFERTSDNLILFKELVYVSEHQQKNIIQIYHDKLLRDHWGTHKTIEAIFWSYYFSHMRKKVQSYMNRCDLYYKTKFAKHRSYREMRTALTSSWLWASVVMNFIVKLSPSKKLLTKVIYDLILIIVNQLIKKVRFLPYKEASNVKELTYTFLRNVTVL